MLGFPELVFIAVLAAFVLGPERLPGFFRSAVRTVASWRAELRGVTDQLRDEFDVRDVEAELAAMRRELAELRDLPERALSFSPPTQTPASTPEGAAGEVSAGEGAAGEVSAGEGAADEVSAGEGAADEVSSAHREKMPAGPKGEQEPGPAVEPQAETTS